MSHLVKRGRARSWVLVYQEPGGESEVWLHVLEVPTELGRQDVELALRSWPQWSRWAGRVAIGARLTVRLWRARDGEQWTQDAVAWAEIIPEAGRFTVEVDAELRAAVRRAAAARGQSVQAWCVDALSAATAAQGATG